jgi:hypothetical protein
MSARQAEQAINLCILGTPPRFWRDYVKMFVDPVNAQFQALGGARRRLQSTSAPTHHRVDDAVSAGPAIYCLSPE